MMRWIAVLCLVLSAGAGAAQSTGLTRLTDRYDLLGWEAVGRLDMNGTGFCTGTLIGRDLVLTAAHCVYDPRTHAPIDAGRLRFRAGLRDGEAVADRGVKTVVAHAGYTPGQGMTLQNVRHDVALLRLDQPVTTTQADPFALFDGEIDSTDVNVASYGRGRSEALSRQRLCQIVARQPNLMAFDCDVTFGSSGAPVFAGSGGRGRILSIISGGGMVDGRPVALGMSLPQRVQELKTAMAGYRPPVSAPGQIRRLGTGEGRSGTGAKFVRPGGS